MIELFHYFPVEILYILGGVIPIGCIALLTFSTKTMEIFFECKGYTEIFEQVDFSDKNELEEDLQKMPKGRIRANYGDWDEDQEEDRIVFDVLVSKAGLPIHSNTYINIFLDRDATIRPDGIELTLLDMSGKFPEPIYDDQMRIRTNKGKGEFGIEIKKGLNFGELDKPNWFKIELRAETKKTTFGGKIEKNFSYEFFIGPPLGKTWVGFDPGTSASCIATGSSIHLNKTNEVIIALDNQGNEKITPSQIKFLENREAQQDIDSRQIPENLYRIGEEAKNLESGKGVKSFLSVKKLLGYQDEQKITFKDGKELRMTGKGLTSLLVKKVYQDLSAYVKEPKNNAQQLLNEGNFTPKRAVVAIPNNFTAQKTHDMLDSVRAMGIFKEVRYVYEAEAVMMYCLRNKIRNFQNGTLLIFDMGGATINATLVRATKEGNDYFIDILGKIGYGVGGDSIDYCMARTLFGHKESYEELNKTNAFRNAIQLPLQAQKNQIDLRIKLRDTVLEPWKKQIVKNGLNKKSDFLAVNGKLSRTERQILKNLTEGVLGLDRVESVDENVFLQKFYHQFHQDSQSPAFENPYFKKYIYESVTDATKEILRFLDDENNILDHIVFSGRSVFFPGIKETILRTISTEGIKLKEDAEISLKFEEAKTAVAKGACLFGILGSNVHLQNKKTFSAYGYTESESAGKMSMKFTELISIGQTFNLPEDSTLSNLNYCQGYVQGLDKKFGLDGQQVNFYQVMDSDPSRIIREGLQHRYSLVASLPVKKYVDQIAMRVFENDLVACAVHERGARKSIWSKVEIPEMKIAKDNEDHYTWLVQ